MKLLLCLMIAILAAVVNTQRANTTLQPMNWSTDTVLYRPSFQIGTAKDLLVYYDFSGDNLVMAIRRRNSEGVYEAVGNFSDVTSIYTNTNGKWIALMGVIFRNGGVGLFNIDGNNTISSYSTIDSAYGGFLLSDDTFVSADYFPLDDGNYPIRTYQYEASTNTWNNIPGTEVNVYLGSYASGDFSTYRATDDHLVFCSFPETNVTVRIYSRQADKSWKFEESFPVNSTFLGASVTYNGVDTVTFAPQEDFFFIYTKLNSVWTEQLVTSSSVGYRSAGTDSLGYFASVIVFINTNTMLVTAGLEGYDEDANVGKVLVMTKDSNGLWEPSLDVVNPVGSGYFGFALGVNDYDIIAPHAIDISEDISHLTFYTAPLCFIQPINVTCVNQQVSDCSQLDVAQVSLSSLYTINNPQCGNTTASLVSTNSINTNTLEVHFSFSRDLVATVFCNVTVTCPAAPIAQSTPGTDQTPSQGSGAPIATPKGTNTASEANIVGLGFVSLFFVLLSM